MSQDSAEQQDGPQDVGQQDGQDDQPGQDAGQDAEPGQDAESVLPPLLTISVSVTVRAEASEAGDLVGKVVRAMCPPQGATLQSASMHVLDDDPEPERCLHLVSRGGQDAQVFVYDDPCGAAQHAQAIGGVVAEVPLSHDFRRSPESRPAEGAGG